MLKDFFKKELYGKISAQKIVNQLVIVSRPNLPLLSRLFQNGVLTVWQWGYSSCTRSFHLWHLHFSICKRFVRNTGEFSHFFQGSYTTTNHAGNKKRNPTENGRVESKNKGVGATVFLICKIRLDGKHTANSIESLMILTIAFSFITNGMQVCFLKVLRVLCMLYFRTPRNGCYKRYHILTWISIVLG